MIEKHKDPKKQLASEDAPQKDPTYPVELAGILGGVARRVPDAAGRAADSMLAVYKERFTYTFICAEEVASIHFDRRKGEVFLKGHNVKFMTLSEAQTQALWDLAEVLARDREGQRLVAAYRETLASLLADK
jgi:hypothetical protein